MKNTRSKSPVTTTIAQAATLGKNTKLINLSSGKTVWVVCSAPCWTTVRYNNGKRVRVRTASLRNRACYAFA